MARVFKSADQTRSPSRVYLRRVVPLSENRLSWESEGPFAVRFVIRQSNCPFALYLASPFVPATKQFPAWSTFNLPESIFRAQIASPLPPYFARIPPEFVTVEESNEARPPIVPEM